MISLLITLLVLVVVIYICGCCSRCWGSRSR